VAVADGEVLDLGGRKLLVVHSPGHTRGSICIYDEITGTLFAGDNLQARETTLCEWNSGAVEEFRDTLLKLQALRPTKVMGGHLPNINGPELIGRILRCTEAVLNGAMGEEKRTRGGGAGLYYELDGVGICYRENNIYRSI
jgi:glyoxylase-like metal-dependent hydrolase (beta-lactamase superfamily II)